ncbi:unnamed protein product, partial [Trichogramma brassicae]
MNSSLRKIVKSRTRARGEAVLITTEVYESKLAEAKAKSTKRKSAPSKVVPAKKKKPMSYQIPRVRALRPFRKFALHINFFMTACSSRKSVDLARRKRRFFHVVQNRWRPSFQWNFLLSYSYYYLGSEAKAYIAGGSKKEKSQIPRVRALRPFRKFALHINFFMTACSSRKSVDLARRKRRFFHVVQNRW